MRIIVDDGTIAKVTTNRAKAISVELIVLSTELIETYSQFILRIGLSTTEGFFEPFEEARQSNSISSHRLTEAGEFGRVLDSLKLREG